MDRKASSSAWLAGHVGAGNRDQIEAPLGKVRGLKGEFGLKEPLMRFCRWFGVVE